MKINPYFYFNGNAGEVIAFYEQVFGSKARIMKYADVAAYDKSYEIASGTENYVMHANMNLGDSMIMFCDAPPDMSYRISDGLQLIVSMESVAKVKEVFDKLKNGGTVIMEPQKTFWSDSFCAVKDKFGITWMLSYENEVQQAQVYGK